MRVVEEQVEARSPMPLVRLKPKGQMTIPAALRDRLRLRQGDLLEVSTDGRAIILVPKAVIDREGPAEPGGAPAAGAR